MGSATIPPRRPSGSDRDRLRGQVVVREEEPTDIAAVRDVNERAFGRADEADLVDKLRDRRKVTLSLVAVKDGRALGHILFSPATIESGAEAFPAVALGPMAVLPECKRQGIGSALVRNGLAACRRAGHEVVIVQGHAEYYPRFGFVRASMFGVRCEYDVPDDVFMLTELRQGALLRHGGTARYQPEFGEL